MILTSLIELFITSIIVFVYYKTSSSFSINISLDEIVFRLDYFGKAIIIDEMIINCNYLGYLNLLLIMLIIVKRLLKTRMTEWLLLFFWSCVILNIVILSFVLMNVFLFPSKCFDILFEYSKMTIDITYAQEYKINFAQRILINKMPSVIMLFPSMDFTIISTNDLTLTEIAAMCDEFLNNYFDYKKNQFKFLITEEQKWFYSKTIDYKIDVAFSIMGILLFELFTMTLLCCGALILYDFSVAVPNFILNKFFHEFIQQKAITIFIQKTQGSLIFDMDAVALYDFNQTVAQLMIKEFGSVAVLLNRIPDIS